MTNNSLTQDLDSILEECGSSLELLAGKKIFLTGGTGFFGKWLLETFIYANEKINLNLEVLVLSRDPESFRITHPHLASNHLVSFHKGDVRDFVFPDFEPDFIIHAATRASATFNREEPGLMFDTIVTGTRRVLDFARNSPARKVLLTSSGAVYGNLPHDLEKVNETYPGSPDTTDPGSAYGEGKRVSEMLSCIFSRENQVDVLLARAFAFVGPYLPLDGTLAIGNFIREGLAGRNIVVEGDGTTRRSYLYAADLVVWLLTILTHGKSCYPYNVGSENQLSIAELAHTVAAFFPSVSVEVRGKTIAGQTIQRYVPDTYRARKQLGLREINSLQEAIEKTILFQQNQKQLT